MYTQEFKNTVKAFMSDTGITIAQIAAKVDYKSTTRLKKFIFNNEGTLTLATVDKIIDFINSEKA